MGYLTGHPMVQTIPHLMAGINPMGYHPVACPMIYPMSHSVGHTNHCILHGMYHGVHHGMYHKMVSMPCVASWIIPW